MAENKHENPFNEQERKTYGFLKKRPMAARNSYVKKVLENPTDMSKVAAVKRMLKEYPHWFDANLPKPERK